MATIPLHHHGERVPAKVTERTGQLASEGKAEGLTLRKEVTRRLDQLMKAGFKPVTRTFALRLSRAYPRPLGGLGDLRMSLSH